MALSSTKNSIATEQSIKRKLKTIGNLQTFLRIDDTKDNQLAVLLFCHTRQTYDNGQLPYNVGFLLDEFVNDSIYHVLKFCTHKAKRSVCLTGAAEILDVGEAIDEGKFLAQMLFSLYNRKLTLSVAPNLKTFLLYCLLSRIVLIIRFVQTQI